MRRITPVAAIAGGLLISEGPVRADDAQDAARHAVAAFDRICVRQAPDFRRSRGLMARFGLVEEDETNTVRNPAGTLSATVRTPPEEPAECWIGFSDAGRAVRDNGGREHRAAAGGRRLGPARPAAWTTGRPMEVWSVLIHGARGALFHVPPTEGADRGYVGLRF